MKENNLDDTKLIISNFEKLSKKINKHLSTLKTYKVDFTLPELQYEKINYFDINIPDLLFSPKLDEKIEKFNQSYHDLKNEMNEINNSNSKNDFVIPKNDVKYLEDYKKFLNEYRNMYLLDRKITLLNVAKNSLTQTTRQNYKKYLEIFSEENKKFIEYCNQYRLTKLDFIKEDLDTFATIEECLQEPLKSKNNLIKYSILTLFILAITLITTGVTLVVMG